MSPQDIRIRQQFLLLFLLFLQQVEEHVYHKAFVIDMHFLKKIETYAGTNSYYYRYIFKVALHFPDTDFWLI